MASYAVKIPMNPSPKLSVRVGRGGAWNPNRYGMEQLKAWLMMSLPMGVSAPLLSSPLLMIVHFHIPLPPKATKARKQAENQKPHAQRPDIDNLLKYLNDCLSTILFKDDSQVAWLVASKTWTSDPKGHIELFLKELPPGMVNRATVIEDLSHHLT